MTTPLFALLLLALLLAAVPRGEAADDRLAAALRQPFLGAGTARQELAAYVSARIPPLPDPPDAAAWGLAQERLRRRFLEEVVYRGVPASWREGPARVEWGEALPARGGYVIRKLRYEAVPGLWIPALLYQPEGEAKGLAAVLNVNGHVGAPGKAIEYEQIRCINLAKRGMLALHPEWLNCGELAHPEYTHNRLAYLDLCGRSGLAVFYLAMRRGLDLLAAHPRADPARLAMTGLSGGGWQTIWLSALDSRVAATAPNAGYIGLPERLRHPEDIGDLEQNPVDLLRVGDYPLLTALLAPRPALLLFNERDDCCFQTARAVPSVYEPVVPFYRLSGRAEAFTFHNNTDPGSHNYEQDNRSQFYRFLGRAFNRPENGVEIRCDDEVLPFATLQAGVPPPLAAGPAGQSTNATFGSLAESMLASLPRSRWPAGDAATGKAWQTRSRQQLAALLRLPAPAAAATVPLPQGVRDRETLPETVTLFRRLLRVGPWTLPAVELRPEKPAGAAVVAAEAHRDAAAETARALIARGLRVVVVDLALTGENDPGTGSRAQQAMILGAAGERLLGVQVAQLLAVIGWLASDAGVDRLTLAGVGRSGATAAAVAAALDERRVAELLAVGLPASLKLLIEERIEYDACPELFCFGLLEQFDVRELLGMAAADRITLFHPGGKQERVMRELGSLGAFRRLLGGETRFEFTAARPAAADPPPGGSAGD
jgi:dienelactone hydrolase